MTLSNITTLSLFTDNAPASPAYFNAKWAELQANLDSIAASTGTDFGQVTSGSTTTFPVTRNFILRSYDSGGGILNLRAFGVVADGSTDDAAALQSAFSANVNGAFLLPQGTSVLGSTVTIYGQVKLFAYNRGTSRFFKRHVDDLFHVGSGQVEFHDVGLAADTATSATYAQGRLVYVNNFGGAFGTTPNFKFLGGSMVNSDNCIEFGNDAGSGAMVANTHIEPFTSTQDAEGFAISMNSDSAARPRMFVNVTAPRISIASAQDTFFSNCFIRRVEMNEGSFGLNVAGCRWGNSGSTMTIKGGANFIVGNSMSGPVVLDSSFTGVYVGNDRTGTAYKLTSNAVAQNVLIVDRELTSLGTLRATSSLSLGVGGTPITAISSTSSLVAAFVVQGSASSFTIITWAAVKANDIIMVTPTSLNGAVSSLSSGIVAHSHCTQNGQVELRLSNVSTLAQNVSSKTWYFVRVTPF